MTRSGGRKGRYAGGGQIAAPAHGPEHVYKLDKKGKCRDEHNKFAKDEFCHH